MARITPGSPARGRPRMRSSDIVVDDERLSLAAKGVFVSVTLLGDGCHLEDLARLCRDHVGDVEAAVLELVRLRYLRLQGSVVHFGDPLRFGIPEA